MTMMPSTSGGESSNTDFNRKTSIKSAKPKLPQCTPENIVSLDCEMVGCGPKGRISALGRCSIVDYNGKIVYDSYIKPLLPVTDYRTPWSGIKPKHLQNAISFNEAGRIIKKHLSGKYIVGHDLRSDFQVIKMIPNPLLVKDTSTNIALRHLAGLPENKRPSLKKLTGIILGKSIQMTFSGHCSVEDARSALFLFKKVEDQWDAYTKSPRSSSSPSSSSSPGYSPRHG